ncbi:MAG: hypothetical protein DRJ10_01200 [Bacteroidetes bacterium]|nr:MAG: hypothetical protein DRJ10_01200 [Bacteroidota bacterium]
MTRTRHKNWKVEKSPKFKHLGGDFKITNLKTGKIYYMSSSEFVFGCGMYNEIVETFPNYVHYCVWDM